MTTIFVSNEMWDSSTREAFEIPGEPAIVINGLPDACATSNDGSVNCSASVVEEPDREKGFGDWLEGREVKKLFGGEYYSGVVTEYDKDTGWYRVIYEDGDCEDLDWHELAELIKPLDIMVPLKSLALKMVKASKKTEQGSVRSQARLAKSVASKGKRASVKPGNNYAGF